MRGMTLSILTAIVLAGCNNNSLDNQIEKCVQAGVKFDEPYKTDKSRYEQEARMRLACLKAASGKPD